MRVALKILIIGGTAYFILSLLPLRISIPIYVAAVSWVLYHLLFRIALWIKP